MLGVGVVHRLDNGAGWRLPAEDGSVRCPALDEIVDVEHCQACPWWVSTRMDTRGDGEVICRVPVDETEHAEPVEAERARHEEPD